MDSNYKTLHLDSLCLEEGKFETHKVPPLLSETIRALDLDSAETPFVWKHIYKPAYRPLRLQYTGSVERHMTIPITQIKYEGRERGSVEQKMHIRRVRHCLLHGGFQPIAIAQVPILPERNQRMERQRAETTKHHRITSETFRVKEARQLEQEKVKEYVSSACDQRSWAWYRRNFLYIKPRSITL